MNKGEREELRRLLRAQFKVLRADVDARRAELEAELEAEIAAEYAAIDKAYDDTVYQIRLAVDEANRRANDLCRELWGREIWGEKYDRTVVTAGDPGKPGVKERRERRRLGLVEIERRVKRARLELDRRENELLTQLATTALESTEAREFFARIPAVTDLVPAYRLQEIAGIDSLGELP